MILPSPMSGTGPAAAWLEKLREFVRRNRLLPGVGYRLKQFSDGVALELLPTAGGASNPDKRYRIKSVQDDYLTCRSWDGTTEGTTDVYIAKMPKHRCSLLTATIFGDNHSYTYAATSDPNNKQRTNTDTDTGAVETELITPPWLVNDEVWAREVSSTSVQDPNGIEIKLLYGGDFRQWASQPPP